MLRTDLAVEEIESQQQKPKEYQKYGCSILEVIITKDQEKKFRKKEGRYYTLSTDSFVTFDHDNHENVSKALSTIIAGILKEKNITRQDAVLVVGLGNDQITPDALGPGVIDHLFVTKHLYDLGEHFDEKTMGIVSAIAPGVMGQTGMETSDIIKAIVKKEKPKLVIIIDALASRSLERVNQTIQITTAGINPGSGVGNKRKELSEKTLGIPVIAIGIPTVVDVASITNDTIEYLTSILSEAKDPEYQKYEEISQNKDALFRAIIGPSHLNFMVTPKEIDELIFSMSDVIARALNLSLHKLEKI